MNKGQLRLFLIFSTVVLTFQFKAQVVNVAGVGWFQGFSIGTASIIAGRLALSEQRGLFAEGGLLGRDVVAPEGVPVWDYQYQVYFSDIPIQRYTLYQSAHGLQALIFGIIDKLSPLPDRRNFLLFLWLSALFSAVVFSLFLSWAATTFGKFPAFFCLLCIFLSPWLVVSAGHPYFLSGSLLIPFVVGLKLHQREKDGSGISGWLVFALTALGLFAKCLFSGYELITSVLVLSTIPVFFYAVLDRWKLRYSVTRFLLVASASLVGVLLSMGLLIFQIDRAEAQEVRGLDHIQERFLARTVGKDPQIYSEWASGKRKESVEATRWDVIKIYLNEGAFFRTAGSQKEIVVRFRSMIGILLLLNLAQRLLLKDALLKPLLVAGYVGLLSPLSWFVIFKSHSYLHPFTNSIVWYFPFMLLVYLGTGYVGALMFGRVNRRWRREMRS